MRLWDFGFLLWFWKYPLEGSWIRLWSWFFTDFPDRKKQGKSWGRYGREGKLVPTLLCILYAPLHFFPFINSVDAEYTSLHSNLIFAHPHQRFLDFSPLVCSMSHKLRCWQSFEFSNVQQSTEHFMFHDSCFTSHDSCHTSPESIDSFPGWAVVLLKVYQQFFLLISKTSKTLHSPSPSSLILYSFFYDVLEKHNRTLG